VKLQIKTNVNEMTMDPHHINFHYIVHDAV